MRDDQTESSPTAEGETLSALERDYLRRALNFQPYIEKSPGDIEEQQAFQDILKRRAGAVHFGANCFVSPQAQIFTSYFSIGQNSWIASVLFDLRLWFKLLAPSGVLIGDDYGGFAGVRKAVSEVVDAENLIFKTDGQKFTLRPSAVR